MSIESKEVLKTHFETDSIPTETHFANLIDSAVTLTPSFTASVQFGTGTITSENCIQFGSLKIFTVEQDPATAPAGSMWLDSFGKIVIKSGSRVIVL